MMLLFDQRNLEEFMDKASDFLLKHRKAILTLAFVAIAVGLFWPETSSKPKHVQTDGESSVSPDSDKTPVVERLPSIEPIAPPFEEFAYTVASGDTLGSIFNELQLPRATMYKLLEADEDFLQLDSLKPGQTLTFTREGDDLLVTRMVVEIDRIQQLQFVRKNDAYTGKLIVQETTPVERRVNGVVQGSLYLSASRAGLTAAEIATISRLFDEKVNFARDFRAGDSFQILYDDLYIADQPTGRSTLKAVVIHAGKRQLAAFRHTDGQYYDENGRSLNRAFLKRPLQQRFRISSSFNPQRIHPVTGRITTHNGTDYATPTGTPVLTISDGVVTRVGNHPIAGKYINIEHTDRYSTRYLHMDKIHVRQGQRVGIGDVIGLSGSTGRVTGPHLHFELHVNGRSTNFITYRLPEARQLDEQQMVAFRSLMKNYLARLDGSASESESLIG